MTNPSVFAHDCPKRGYLYERQKKGEPCVLKVTKGVYTPHTTHSWPHVGPRRVMQASAPGSMGMPVCWGGMQAWRLVQRAAKGHWELCAREAQYDKECCYWESVRCPPHWFHYFRQRARACETQWIIYFF